MHSGILTNATPDQTKSGVMSDRHSIIKNYTMKNQSFSELGISPEILKAVDEMGFEAPTSIQNRCIPAILSNRDLVGQAQTGTGKTAAFGIPALQNANKGSKTPSVLILCPTRELAIQVTGELIKLAKYVDGVYTVPVYGG